MNMLNQNTIKVFKSMSGIYQDHYPVSRQLRYPLLQSIMQLSDNSSLAVAANCNYALRSLQLQLACSCSCFIAPITTAAGQTACCCRS